MSHVRSAAAVVAASLVAASCADTSAPVTAPDEYAAAFSTELALEDEATGYHIVVFDEEAVLSGFAARVEALGGTVEAAHDAIGVATVSGLSDEAAADLRASEGILHVEEDEVLEMDLPVDEGEPEDASADEDSVDPAGTNNPAGAGRFSYQWNMRAIAADQAWSEGHLGSSDVTVAILDTGIDYTHVDLQGLVDLDRSVSFVASEDRLVQRRFPGAHPIADLRGHGTHVAATVSSNARRAAGVTSKTTLVGVKVCRGGCPISAIYRGVAYAADIGADVINMSLGGNYRLSQRPGLAATVNRVMNYATRQGALVVVSAGNSRADLDHDRDGFKTYCSAATTLCVSATGPTSGGNAGPWTNIDTPANYTNYGRSAINVAAPGGRGGQGVWAACSSFGTPTVCRTGKTWIIRKNGTSMAAPHVSGLAALLVHKYGKDNPGRIMTAIQDAADDLGTPGVDPYYGKGRINVFRASAGQ